MPKPKKKRKVSYELINDSGIHRMLKDVVRKWHPEIIDANIALVWQLGMKADADNHVTLGKARKQSDLLRELIDFDFIITINTEMWHRLSDAQRTALLDHECMHCTVALDENGEAKFDERGRPCWRVRKHDIEEFEDIVHRHGCYKKDLQDFAQAAIDSKKTPLLNEAS